MVLGEQPWAQNEGGTHGPIEMRNNLASRIAWQRQQNKSKFDLRQVNQLTFPSISG